MGRTIFRIIGYGLTGLIFVGLGIRVLAAFLAGEPVYGLNYKSQPLGTYSTLAALVIATPIVAVLIWQRIRAWLRKRDV